MLVHACTCCARLCIGLPTWEGMEQEVDSLAMRRRHATVPTISLHLYRGSTQSETVVPCTVMLRQPARVPPGPGVPHSAGQRWLPAGRWPPRGARLQRGAQRHQGYRELMRQRRLRPTVGMGQGNELPHGAVERRPLGRKLPLDLGLRLGHLGRQRLDSLANVGALRHVRSRSIRS